MHSFARCFAGGLAVLFMCIAGASLYCTIQYEQRIRHLQQAVPMRLAVDLSERGTYAGDFTQMYIPPMDVYLHVEVPSDATKSVADGALLSGLIARFIVTDRLGNTVYESTLEGDSLIEHALPSGRRERAFRMRSPSFPVGAYDARLQVEEPAPALAAIPHELVARYSVSLLPTVKFYTLPIMVIALFGAIGAIAWWWRFSRVEARQFMKEVE